MSSRATKKRVWRLRNMTNGEWLNMISRIKKPLRIQFRDWCIIHGIWRHIEE